ncbi:PREDICTED: bidirectional sugar transporter SWEET2a-like [Ipomoea nil]|uniref:bidirectional sugar transporter SWEET2a-like n=1 Tax=Ipomoea nil TaxID=35883 RepID=UPI0009016A21|nr:PREDICTED: bidirectional sugar transporter SWEET2a-like [Ipomoea nil]
MSPLALSSVYSICSFAAGVAGNVFAFVLFVSPIPTFRRIIRSQSTEQFSELPYIYGLLNCLICLWYATPIVTPGIILVFTVNSFGGVFQLAYITIFIVYAERTKKLKTLGWLLGVFAVFAVIVSVSIFAFQPPTRQIFVGYLSVLSLISMFASPLFIINLVIKTRSVEYMPFYLSLATFLMSLSFFAYGLLLYDLFISVPNGIGAVLGIIQLVLYFYISGRSGEDPRTPLLESYA